jgi:pyruvate, orthophosphate dikinase
MKKKPFFVCEPNKLDELLHPVLKKSYSKMQSFGKRTSCFSRCCHRTDCFFADEVLKMGQEGKKVSWFVSKLLLKTLKGMNLQRYSYCRGGMTSHAAVVARGMGKCCVSGAGG